MKREVCILFMVLLGAFPVSAAIGVTPPIYEIDFQPNLKQVFHFTFVGDKNSVLEINIENGSLAQYALLSTERISGTGTVFVSVQLPATIDTPGLNGIGIRATEVPPDSDGLYLVGSVIGAIRIRVPYPGEYAELSLATENANAGEPVKLSLTTWSRGNNAITTNSRLDIYDFEKKVQTIPLGSDLIQPKESKTIDYVLDTGSYNPGRYRVVAVVDYNGKQATTEGIFRLGELSVDVVNYSNGFLRNKINRFEIEVESNWNDPIDSVYADVEIVGHPESNFLTPTVGLRSFERKTLTGFFDARTIEEDSFQAQITLNYQNKTSTKTVSLEFRKEFDYVKLAIIGGVILVLAIIITLVYITLRLRRRLNETKKRK